MSTVLAALDHDACAQPALDTAIAFAALVGASVIALYVQEDKSHSPAHLPRATGVTLTTATGSPTQEIVSAARDPGIAAVVIGARGARGGSEPAGHTAIDVITRVPKPVIIVPAEAHPSPEIRRILLPIEETSSGPAKLKDAIALADGRTLEIVALNVSTARTVQAFSDHAPHAGRAWEHEFIARHLPPPHDRITVERRLGIPADQILTAAHDCASDLIVLSWGQNLTSGHARVVAETLAQTDLAVMLVPSW